MSELPQGEYSVRPCPVSEFRKIEMAPDDVGTIRMVYWQGETHGGEVAFTQGEHAYAYAALLAQAPGMAEEIKRLKAINAELLASCKALLFDKNSSLVIKSARMAIARAEAQP